MGDPAGLPTAYLAQMDLDDARALQDDVPALPHFSTGPKGTLYRRTLWIGPDGTFTPFHKDPYIGLYSQGGRILERSGEGTCEELTSESSVREKDVLRPPA